MKRLFTVLDAKGRELEAQMDIDRDELMFVWRAQLLDASNVVGVVSGMSANLDDLQTDVQAKVIEDDIDATRSMS